MLGTLGTNTHSDPGEGFCHHVGWRCSLVAAGRWHHLVARTVAVVLSVLEQVDWDSPAQGFARGWGACFFMVLQGSWEMDRDPPVVLIYAARAQELGSAKTFCPSMSFALMKTQFSMHREIFFGNRFVCLATNFHFHFTVFHFWLETTPES